MKHGVRPTLHEGTTGVPVHIRVRGRGEGRRAFHDVFQPFRRTLRQRGFRLRPGTLLCRHGPCPLRSRDGPQRLEIGQSSRGFHHRLAFFFRQGQRRRGELPGGLVEFVLSNGLCGLAKRSPDHGIGLRFQFRDLAKGVAYGFRKCGYTFLFGPIGLRDLLSKLVELRLQISRRSLLRLSEMFRSPGIVASPCRICRPAQLLGSARFHLRRQGFRLPDRVRQRDGQFRRSGFLRPIECVRGLPGQVGFRAVGQAFRHSTHALRGGVIVSEICLLQCVEIAQRPGFRGCVEGFAFERYRLRNRGRHVVKRFAHFRHRTVDIHRVRHVFQSFLADPVNWLGRLLRVDGAPVGELIFEFRGFACRVLPGVHDLLVRLLKGRVALHFGGLVLEELFQP